MILWQTQDTGGTINTKLVFNNDTGTNYAIRYSINGGADTATASTAFALTYPATSAAPKLGFAHISNITAVEKLVIGQAVDRGTAGAANTPNKVEFSGKWANTAAQISRIDLVNDGTGDFAIGSELVVLGHN